MTITNEQFESIAASYILLITDHSPWFDSGKNGVAILDDLKLLYEWGSHDTTGSIPWDMTTESMKRASLFLCWIGHAELYAAVDIVDHGGKSWVYQYNRIASNPNTFESWMRSDVANRAGIDLADVRPMVPRRVRLKRRGVAMKFKAGQDLILEILADAQREDQTRRDMSASGIPELKPEFDSREMFDPHNLSEGTYAMEDDGSSGGAARIPALATLELKPTNDTTSDDRPVAGTKTVNSPKKKQTRGKGKSTTPTGKEKRAHDLEVQGYSPKQIAAEMDIGKSRVSQLINGHKKKNAATDKGSNGRSVDLSRANTLLDNDEAARIV